MSTMLYGLVLTGGRSERMKQDKASLKFHEKNQCAHSYDLLSQFCHRVFISNRRDQSASREQKSFPQIHDRPPFEDVGPIGGMLSAMEKYPKASWIVLAVDLPFVDKETIECLMENRNEQKIATAYKNANDDLPEPLCAFYEPKARASLLTYFLEGNKCPRKFLMGADTHLIALPKDNALNNINNPEEYREALSELKED